VTAVFASSPSGGPTLSNATAITDADGRATFSGLAINGVPGNYTLRFESAPLGSVTSGTITLSVGPLAALAILTQPESPAVNGRSWRTILSCGSGTRLATTWPAPRSR